MHRRALPALALVLALAPAPARAGIWGEENILLGKIASTLDFNLSTALEQMAQLAAVYAEVKRYAGYADDARDAYLAAKNWNVNVLTVDELLETAFPDITRLRRELDSSSWEGSGELQRMTRYCFGDWVTETDPEKVCVELRDALSAKQAREAFSAAFTEKPDLIKKGLDSQVIDDEAAVAWAAAHADQQQALLADAQAKLLLEQCKKTNDAAACQAAANAAQIKDLELTAKITSQLAESNRLQALQLQQENNRRKREVAEMEAQRRMTVEAAQQAVRKPIRIESDGFNLLPPEK